MTMNWRGRLLTSDELSEVRSDPATAPGIMRAEAEEKHELELKKLWHGVKWIITRSEIPGGAENGILGGREILRDETGTYRLVEPDAVEEVALALEGATKDDFSDGFIPHEMEDESVYPAIWDEEDVLEGRLVPAFAKYKSFFKRAAKSQGAVLTRIG